MMKLYMPFAALIAPVWWCGFLILLVCFVASGWAVELNYVDSHLAKIADTILVIVFAVYFLLTTRFFVGVTENKCLLQVYKFRLAISNLFLLNLLFFLGVETIYIHRHLEVTIFNYTYIAAFGVFIPHLALFRIGKGDSVFGVPNDIRLKNSVIRTGAIFPGLIPFFVALYAYFRDKPNVIQGLIWESDFDTIIHALVLFGLLTFSAIFVYSMFRFVKGKV